MEDLPAFHELLDIHFSKLAAVRKEICSPTFAIEHSLNQTQLSSLAGAVRSHISTFTPDPNSWLPWAVYAVEIGYEFDGHEYWDSFQAKTPGWTIHERSFLRDCFKKFVKSYGGFTPIGAWAEHRSIICFPITHSIIPKDLQYQLARILYDLRFQLHSIRQSPDQLGTRISEVSNGTSNRFQLLAENTQLVGLIARELLSHDDDNSPKIILPSTLNRIVEDLRLHHEAGSMLDEARRFSSHPQLRKSARPKIDEHNLQRIRLQPNLILRPSGSTTWDLFVELPDLLPLAEKFPEVREYLISSRPKITGSFYDDRLARGTLLSHGPIRRKLKALPTTTQALLQFGSDLPASLDNFINEEFSLRVGVNILFKLQSDGLAYRQESTSVIPGTHYYLLAKNPPLDNSMAVEQDVSCEGWHLYSIRLPEVLSNLEESSLKSLGLTTTTGVRIIPLGTPSSNRGAYIEFLASESPCLSLELVNEVETLKLEFAGQTLNVSEPLSGSPIFVELGIQPIGSYEFVVSSRRTDHEDYEILDVVEINIREPRSRQEVSTNQNALLLITTPFRPTMEQLFDGKVNFDFRAPVGTKVNISLTLFLSQQGRLPSLRKKLFDTVLPDHEIGSNIANFLSSPSLDRQVRDKFLDASACNVEFEAGELGTIPVNFEREFLPVRWVVSTDSGAPRIRLMDYSDSGSMPTITKYDFSSPDNGIKLQSVDDIQVGYPILPSGGLYVAELPETKQGIVIFRHMENRSYRNFSELCPKDDFEPHFCNYPRTVNDLVVLLGLHNLWTISEWRGNPLRLRDRHLLSKAFIREIVSIIDDSDTWKKAEKRYIDGNDKNGVNLLRAVTSKPSLMTAFSKRCADAVNCSPQQLTRLMVSVVHDAVPDARTIVKKKNDVTLIRVIPTEWFVEFAMRLCSRPESIHKWAGDRFEIGLSKLLENPILARGARYIVLRAEQNGWYGKPYIWSWE